jgi:hypothetical protein
MYRLAADVFNDGAMILDCLSPAFPKAARVMLLSFSSVLRALCGVAAGSSKASLSAHFATQGNLGELNAKDSSQETIISLMGMLAGSLIVPYITSPSSTWIALLGLLAIHLCMNYFAVRAVTMRTLNRQRANIVFSTYLESYQNTEVKQDNPSQQALLKGVKRGVVPTPEQTAQLETIFERNGVIRLMAFRKTILATCAIGGSLRDILPRLPADVGLDMLWQLFEEQDYILFFHHSDSRWGPSRPKFIIILKQGANTRTQLKAWFHAVSCSYLLATFGDREPPVLRILEGTLNRVEQEWHHLTVALEDAGWDVENGALETRPGPRISDGKKDK